MPRKNGASRSRKAAKPKPVVLPSPPGLSDSGTYRVTWLNGLASICLGYPLRRRFAWYRERVLRIVDVASGKIVFKAA